MRISTTHAPHVGNLIAINLSNSGIVTLTQGIEPVAKHASVLILADLKKESALEEKVRALINENEDDIDFYRADEKQLFWMIKKKLADESGIILGFEERYSNVAHEILDDLYEEGLIEYTISENRVKNVIYSAIDRYMKLFGEIETSVIEKIKGYKRELVFGSEEYEIVFSKLYHEELEKRGMA